MNSKVYFLLSILAFLAFSQLTLVSCRKDKTNHGLDGFTLDLIHRDSPLSPYYNPSITPSQRLRDAFQRSFSRASFFTKASIHPTTLVNHAIQSDIIPDFADYLMKIAIGTPPRKTYAILDTGSELTWIQCKPCTQCYKQILPIFDPRKSSTYKIIGCQSKECKLVREPTCVKTNACEYQVQYGDGSYSTGDVASDTFTFASTSKKVDDISIQHVIFGCGHNNGGNFGNHTAGIVGLGDSKISIINQLDKQIKGKFSYCLVPNGDLSLSYHPPNTTSKINFGPKAVVSGPNVLTTPIIRKKPDVFGYDIFYFLNLESVSVGGKKLEFKSSQLMNSSDVDEDLGNIIIDSGTTLTFLPENFYNKFESILVETIKGKRKIAPPYVDLPICYETKSIVEFPKIVFHFTDADIELLPMNAFSKVAEDVTCLTIVEGGQYGVYGNLAQMNFLIGYDLVNRKLSFLPSDCTKH
ncbi:aspartic proteinase CDR1-like [Solanum tuberosum]|uniref:Aspartic proteinase nepenthesin-2 n=1 Tax=Solanum tuberosum TaxID=4113 RepID=M1BA64_SOLTU|nr:PREDICTED: aspartic proteinase CDR1-like [Solanum tuberosum]